MSHLVDYFAVCGLHIESLEKELTTGHSYTPPLLRSFLPKVLCRYPEQDRSSNPFDEGAITTLCMPDGLHFKKNLQDPAHKYIHTFCITKENGNHEYGTSLMYYELTNDVRTLNNFEALQSKYLQKIRVRLNSSDCNFSRANDKLYVQKCLCFVTPLPVFQSLKVYLEQLHAVTVNQVPCDLPVASYLFNILYEVSPPGPGKLLKFKGPLGTFRLSSPSSTELPACDYSFREFFELLGTKNVVKLLSCLFLEHQVLLKSADLERLSLVAHCARALLWPFNWPHVFVPFLPASQGVFLDAPVPYLMGLRLDTGTQENKYSDLSKVVSLCIVEVDSGRVHCPDELPSLPDESRLLINLSRIILEHGVKVTDPVHWPHPSSPRERTPPPLPSKTVISETIELVKEISKDKKKLKHYFSDSLVLNPHHVLPNNKIINITDRVLSPTLSVDEGAYDMEDEEDAQQQWNYAADRSETRFSSAIREAFVEYFVENLFSYEKFIITPTQNFQQWQNNREQFQNFDKTAYLSDQPTNSKAFFSAFMETSIFSMFVDDKIVAHYRPEMCSKTLLLFDLCIQRHRDKSGLANPPRTPGYRNNSISSETEEDTMMMVDEPVVETAPPPHTLSPPKTTGLPSNSFSPSHTHLSSSPPSAFPFVDPELLQLPSDPRDEQCSPEPSPSSIIRSQRERPKRSSDIHRPLKQYNNFWFSSHSHSKFVSQLMRETRLRVKHMLGNSRESESLIEENTHIAYLCDLLERIWGHGIKKRESKSPLWTHLMAYAETVGRVEFKQGQRVNSPSPPPLSYNSRPRSASLSTLSVLSPANRHPSANVTNVTSSIGSASPRPAQGLRSHFRRNRFQSSDLRARVEAILHPPPSSLVADLLVVHNMHELKTDVGRARGWVRLALEKKALSRHLNELFSHDAEITSHRYREYAFIRTEEEREHFLYHLLTLTAREFSCFTSAFVQTTMKYRVLVVAEGKRFGLSTSSLYLDLAGDFRESERIEIPKGELETTLECENIGELRCLRLGHDNCGMAPSLYVESVLVHNITTGRTYMSSCGHCLGKADEDGSVERFMWMEKVPQTLAKTGTKSILEVTSVLPSSPSGRRRGSKINTEEEAVLRQIILDLKRIMDQIRTAALSRKPDKREMLKLIHGGAGFTKCMEQVLEAGFKSYKKFSKKLHFWDLLERIDDHFSSEDMATIELSAANAYHRAGDYSSSTYYCHEHELSCRDLFQKAVTRINENTSIGKDEKVMRFLCLGLRDHLLRDWLGLVAGSSALPTFYEPKSFLRDPVLLQNLMDTFQLTLSLPINLEPLFVQGL